MSRTEQHEQERSDVVAAAEHPVRTLLRDYEWVHTGLGIVGNLLFVVGSVLFFWDSTQTTGVWLFVFGSAGMFVASVGQAVVRAEERSRSEDRDRERQPA